MNKIFNKKILLGVVAAFLLIVFLFPDAPILALSKYRNLLALVIPPTNNRFSNLEVSNQFKFTSGVTLDNDGKVLTSDATGSASWQTPTTITETDPIVGAVDGVIKSDGNNNFAPATTDDLTEGTNNKYFPGFGALAIGDIPDLPSAKITSGEFDVARIPDLAVSKLTAGGNDGGKVLTVDETTGIPEWKELADEDSYWTEIGGSSSIYRLDGRVGVGVYVADAKLHVADQNGTDPGEAIKVSYGPMGSNATGISLNSGDSRNNYSPYINFHAVDDSKRFSITGSFDDNVESNDILTFGSYNVDNALVIKGNGRIGIGTDEPSAMLEIKGLGAGLIIDSTFADAVIALNSPKGAGLLLNNLWGILRDGESGGNLQILSYNPYFSAFYANKDTGRVGIGTTDPGGLLGLGNENTYLDVDNGGNLTFTDGVSGSKTLAELVGGGDEFWKKINGDIYRENGNVGIGTREPGATLDVNGSLDVSGRFSGGGLHNGFYESIRLSRSGHAAISYRNPNLPDELPLFFGMHQNGNFYWGKGERDENGENKANSAYLMTLANNGSLDVNGTIVADSFIGDGSRLTGISGGPWSFDEGSGDIYRENGNVGIGTASPSSLLDISGITPTITLNDSDTDVGAEQALGTINFQVNDSSASGTGRGAFIRAVSDESVGTRTSLAFGVANVNSDNATEVVRIKNDGNVGIGTASPGQELVVASSEVGTQITLQNEKTASAVNFQDVLFRQKNSGGTVDNFAIIRQDPTDVTAGSEDGQLQFLVMDGGSIDSRLTIDGSNVGIGTTSPGAKLDVAGNIQTTGGGYQVIIGNQAGDYWSTIKNTASSGDGNLVFRPGGQDRVTMLKNGNVGIGTTSPGGLLGLGNENTYLDVDNGGNLTFTDGVSGSKTLADLVGGGDEFWKKINGDIYRENGNVGIGTASPGAKLDILGSTSIVPVHIERSHTTTTAELDLLELHAVSTGDMTDGFGTEMRFIIEDNAAVENVIAKIQASRDTADNEGTLRFFGGTGGGEEFMTIKQNGNVGIGTREPGHLMHIEDNVAGDTTLAVRNSNSGGGGVAKLSVGYSDSAAFDIYRNASSADIFLDANQGNGAIRFQDAGADTLTIDSSGNVGIGTASPGAELDVNGEIRNNEVVRTTGGASTHLASSGGLEFIAGNLRLRSQGADASTQGGFSFLGITSDGSANTEFMTIQNDGNVGIGTTSPGGLLGLGNENTYLDVDNGGNLTFTDGVSGSKTLAELVGGGITESDPVYNANTYAKGMNQDVSTSASPTFGSNVQIKDSLGGATELSHGMAGAFLTSVNMGMRSKYTPALKFGSTSIAFTTENPKFLAGIVGRAMEGYSWDYDGGMALDFLTSPKQPGKSAVPIPRMTIDNNGNVGIGTTSPGANYKLDVAGNINFSGDLYKDGELFTGGEGSVKVAEFEIKFDVMNNGEESIVINLGGSTPAISGTPTNATFLSGSQSGSFASDSTIFTNIGITSSHLRSRYVNAISLPKVSSSVNGSEVTIELASESWVGSGTAPFGTITVSVTAIQP